MTTTTNQSLGDRSAAKSVAERAAAALVEAVAALCPLLVVILFILTFLCQVFDIPSGSMEKTLLVGDHLLVDSITLAPPSTWMPLVRYRGPQRDDIVIFLRSAASDAGGRHTARFLVKRIIGMPGDHIHLHNGIVNINGVAQSQPYAIPTRPENYSDFLDEYPSVRPVTTDDPGATIPKAWATDFRNHIDNGEIVVPPGQYFVMGDNRHNSLDSRFWGFVSRENIVGRPLVTYWSFLIPDNEETPTGIGIDGVGIGYVASHFFSNTRWKRTLHLVY
jgi:signal peptidase I